MVLYRSLTLGATLDVELPQNITQPSRWLSVCRFDDWSNAFRCTDEALLKDGSAVVGLVVSLANPPNQTQSICQMAVVCQQYTGDPGLTQLSATIPWEDAWALCTEDKLGELKTATRMNANSLGAPGINSGLHKGVRLHL